MKRILPSNGNPADDPAHGRVYIVEASAGSGKTYTLAKRYVSLILDPRLKVDEIPLKSILAITFTNKAAFEMKARILELLKKIALDRFVTADEKQDILGSLGADPVFLRRKAYLALDYLIRNYNFFQVQTIDSFINALLSGCAFKLDLSANFRIKSDYSEYLRYSLDRLIDRAGRERPVKELFDRFLLQYLHLENRFGWYPKNDILESLEALLSYANTYGGQFRKFSGSTDDVLALKKKIYGKILELKKLLPESADKRFLDKLEKISSFKKPSVNIDDVSTFFDRQELPVHKGARIDPEALSAWEDIRRDIRDLCETEAFVVFNCYIDMFELFFSEFNSASAADDVVFLAELNRQARRLFDGSFITVPELYLRLSSRFSDYLIDEFQDTSFLQWKNIFPLIEDGLSSAGTLFYVGDKKQAIYRFRGGEVGLFDSVKEDFSAFNQSHSVLSNNYRSREEVVKFNNSIFSAGNLTRAINAMNEKKDTSGGLLLGPDDINEIVGFFRDSRQTNRPDKPDGFVLCRSVSCVDDDDCRERVRTKLLELVGSLAERFNLRDIAILCRSNDEVELFAAWLIEAGIPVESEKTLNIREQTYIKELLSFLKFLSSPIDDLSFASFILSDIFLKASGLKKEKIQDFLFDLGKTKKNRSGGYYYRAFREEFPDVWERLISEFFKSAGFIPPYELTVSIIGRYGILKNFPGFQGFFMRLLELISEQEDEHPNIGQFLAYFESARDEDLYVDISEANSVRVLTIHKSKGLEFRAVALPFVYLDIEINPDIVYLKDDNLNLLRINRPYIKFSPALENIYRREYIKAFIDELNGIYVAFTRARDELYIFVPERKGRKFNYAQLLFPEIEYEGGRKVPCAKEKKSGDSQAQLMTIAPAEYRDWIPLLKEEYIRIDELRNRQKAIRGDILHRIFSLIPGFKGKDIDKVIATAVKKVESEFHAWKDLEEWESTVKEFIGRKSWKRFFWTEEAEIFCEKEFVDSSGKTKRIDRLIIKSDAVEIVDYKSSGEFEEENLASLREYIALISQIYPDRKVKGYFLYFDRPEIREIDG